MNGRFAVVALNPLLTTSETTSFTWLEVANNVAWDPSYRPSSPSGWLVAVQDLWTSAVWSRQFAQDEPIELPAFAHDATMIQIWLVPPEDSTGDGSESYGWLDSPALMIAVVGIVSLLVCVAAFVFVPEIIRRVRHPASEEITEPRHQRHIQYGNTSSQHHHDDDDAEAHTIGDRDESQHIN